MQSGSKRLLSVPNAAHSRHFPPAPIRAPAKEPRVRVPNGSNGGQARSAAGSATWRTGNTDGPVVEGGEV